jgi:(4S)-4-hydroxy-5-phosphonooxypentane-2,3-dione isomerase
LTAITANAAASVRDEAGGLCLDVMEDAQRRTHYFYEIYRDSEAFGEYKAAPHFCSVAPSGGGCVVPGSQINTFSDMVVSHSDELPA